MNKKVRPNYHVLSSITKDDRPNPTTDLGPNYLDLFIILKY